MTVFSQGDFIAGFTFDDVLGAKHGMGLLPLLSSIELELAGHPVGFEVMVDDQ